MKCRLVRDLEFVTVGWKSSGYVHEHPECWRLVRHGCAEPADDECRERANMTVEEMAVVQHAYGRVSRGIAPEDYAAFDAGEMVGYRADGSMIPGPNYQEELDLDEEEEKDDD